MKVATARKDNVVLDVFYDDSPESPRDWANVGTFITWESRNNSPDANEWPNDPSDFREWWQDAWVITEDRDVHITDIGYYDHFDNEQSAHEFKDARSDYPNYRILHVDGAGKDGVLLPVFKYEHSGVIYRTEGFSDPWDSGQVGYIFATAETIAKEFGTPSDRMSEHYKTNDPLEMVKQCLASEVDTYSNWANGQVFGYRLYRVETCDHGDEHEAEEIDSCWGFYPSDDDQFGIKGQLGSEYDDLVDGLDYC